MKARKPFRRLFNRARSAPRLPARAKHGYSSAINFHRKVPMTICPARPASRPAALRPRQRRADEAGRLHGADAGRRRAPNSPTAARRRSTPNCSARPAPARSRSRCWCTAAAGPSNTAASRSCATWPARSPRRASRCGTSNTAAPTRRAAAIPAPTRTSTPRSTCWAPRRTPQQLDLGRIVAIGHSAGGQLVQWIAGREQIPAVEPAVPARGRCRCARSSAWAAWPTCATSSELIKTSCGRDTVRAGRRAEQQPGRMCLPTPTRPS